MSFVFKESEYAALLKSLKIIHYHFINQGNPNHAYLSCTKKWAEQLSISYIELEKDLEQSECKVESKSDAVSIVFDLVYLIYLDDVVDDIELEVAMEFARLLNLKENIVGDLMKAIATARDDGMKESDVKVEISQLVEKGYQEA